MLEVLQASDILNGFALAGAKSAECFVGVPYFEGRTQKLAAKYDLCNLNGIGSDRALDTKCDDS